jgi:hypothetical protein
VDHDPNGLCGSGARYIDAETHRMIFDEWTCGFARDLELQAWWTEKTWHKKFGTAEADQYFWQEV